MSEQTEQIRASFGKWLKDQRTTQKITLEEISTKTSIRLTVLKAIEAEAHDQLPAKVYTVSFVRSFALEVGLDPDEVAQRYLVHRDSETDEKKGPTWDHKYETYTDFNKYFRWLFILLAGVVLILVAWWGYFWLWPQISERIPTKLKIGFVQTESEKSESIEVAAPVSKLDSSSSSDMKKDASTDQPTLPVGDTTEVKKMTRAQTKQPPLESAESEPADSLRPESQTNEPVENINTSSGYKLKIVAVATTWLRITRDGDSPKEYTLLQGDQKELEALSSVNLLIGNAGGVTLTVNGQPYPIEGEKGKVLRVSIP